MAFSSKIVGYMIGDVQPDGITVWVGLQARYEKNKLPHSIIDVYPATAKVIYYPISDPSNRTDVDFSTPLKAVRCGTGKYSHLAYDGVRLTISGLTPDTAYGYEIHISGHECGDFGITESFDKTALKFKTAPESNKAFSVMFSSCQKAKGGAGKDSSQTPWTLAFNAGQPLADINVLLGDTHYANSYQRNRKWAYSIPQFNVENYQNLIAAIPTYAIYDDHDFLDNDIGGDTSVGNKNTKYGLKKERASRYFNGLWPLPIPQQRDRNEGCYHNFSYANVHFFMLDVLYYSKQDGSGAFDNTDELLGETQWQWLSDSLAALPENDIKVICTATTMTRGGRGWDNFPAATQRLKVTLEGQPKVLIASGDVHYTEFIQPSSSKEIQRPEIISSAIGRNMKSSSTRAVHGFAIATFDGKGGGKVSLYNSDETSNPYEEHAIEFYL